jgi:hypothetical protein
MGVEADSGFSFFPCQIGYGSCVMEIRDGLAGVARVLWKVGMSGEELRSVGLVCLCVDHTGRLTRIYLLERDMWKRKSYSSLTQTAYYLGWSSITRYKEIR